MSKEKLSDVFFAVTSCITVGNPSVNMLKSNSDTTLLYDIEPDFDAGNLQAIMEWVCYNIELGDVFIHISGSPKGSKELTFDLDKVTERIKGDDVCVTMTTLDSQRDGNSVEAYLRMLQGLPRFRARSIVAIRNIIVNVAQEDHRDLTSFTYSPLITNVTRVFIDIDRCTVSIIKTIASSLTRGLPKDFIDNMYNRSGSGGFRDFTERPYQYGGGKPSQDMTPEEVQLAILEELKMMRLATTPFNRGPRPY